MIIDATYFTGKIHLPQRTNADGLAVINGFIETYEPEYLRKALGYELAEALISAVDGSGSGAVDQRWSDLLEGKDYEYRDRTYHFEGLEAPRSPIAQYVYYRYMESEATDMSLVGTVVQNVDNNSRVSPLHKMVDAWNYMVEQSVHLYRFMEANRDVYPEWNPTRCYPNEVYHPINEFGI